MGAVLTYERSAADRLTRRDLAALPDDGRRYELVDGLLLVSAAPSPLHQRAVLRLARLLDDACPAELEVFPAPLAVALADDTELQPDVVVARRADLTDVELPAAPVLAVEVLSPSTRRADLGVKLRRLEQVGTAAYWAFDPRAVRLRAWVLRDGAFDLDADVLGDEPYETAVPFPVTVVPASLV
ncbi:MAG TPA: Uma2 family endonuclease [Mycobacteriales bacterium]|jgi:Uma2 family endonuclease